jgi:AraC family transcriptional activator of pobA
MFSTLTTKESDQLLVKYCQAFKKYADDGVIDIDKRLKCKFDFLIYRLEDVTRLMQGMVPPSRQNQHCIVLVNHGNGQKKIGQFSFPIQDDTLFIVPAGIIHSTFYGQNCSGYVLFFDIDFFLKTDVPQHCVSNRKIFKSCTRPYLYSEPNETHFLKVIFESILQENYQFEVEQKEMIAVKILELLISCDRLFAKASLTGNSILYHPVLERFKDSLNANYKYNRSVQFYATTLNVHPNHLNFLLKKHNGLNAKQFINNKIISESKYLLSNSSFIIKEIANKLGFEDPNNFSTFFQKCTGASPLSYRSTLGNQAA